ncbi:MAG: PTS sugar transporter subunit IIA [Nitratireductor sp.]
MELTDLIGPEDIVVNLRSNCKKTLLSDLAEIAAEKTGIASRKIFETLLERERLGTTGIGRGIAIPHGKLDALDGITGILAVLEKPIDFDSVDMEPVDIVFLLLADDKEGAEHLKMLSRIARTLRNESFVTEMRSAGNSDALYVLLSNQEAANAA